MCKSREREREGEKEGGDCVLLFETGWDNSPRHISKDIKGVTPAGVLLNWRNDYLKGTLNHSLSYIGNCRS